MEWSNITFVYQKDLIISAFKFSLFTVADGSTECRESFQSPVSSTCLQSRSVSPCADAVVAAREILNSRPSGTAETSEPCKRRRVAVALKEKVQVGLFKKFFLP